MAAREAALHRLGSRRIAVERPLLPELRAHAVACRWPAERLHHRRQAAGARLGARDGGRAFFKQKTAYAILRSDWSSDVCSSD
eukprot:COSAG01_NODE_23305_length_820_cov_1.090153_1_plen_82_part_10